MATVLEKRKLDSYKIFDQIAGTYDFLNHFLSLGIDVLWRKNLRRHMPKSNYLRALDLATGTGDVALELAKDERVLKVTGMDLSRGMVELGKKKVRRRSLEGKVDLQIGDGVKIPADDQSFDLVTLSFGIRNFSDPDLSLQNIFRVLSPGGRVLIMEFSLPKFKPLRSLYLFYFRNVLPKIGNLLSNHGDAYSYLNKTVENFPYGDEFAEKLKRAGFTNVSYFPQTFGIATIYRGDRPCV
jgi:demethylmenaquinone methyltransferase / 2-methoxy-6-polyprenyl-1,4-benzoquinol methylase